MRGFLLHEGWKKHHFLPKDWLFRFWQCCDAHLIKRPSKLKMLISSRTTEQTNAFKEYISGNGVLFRSKYILNTINTKWWSLYLMFYRSFKAVLANTTETKYALKENLLKVAMTLVLYKICTIAKEIRVLYPFHITFLYPCIGLWSRDECKVYKNT